MKRAPARIELKDDAHAVITAETAKRLPAETGGILLGYREDADIVVTHALAVNENKASTHKYERDDVIANKLLSDFLSERSIDDPTGYIGEWHSHPAPCGPSSIDVAAMRSTARSADGPIALVVHIPSRANAFSGMIAQRHRFGRTTTKEVHVSLPPNRFQPLGPLPNGAVRADGPVFISYRQSDGTPRAESLEHLLRAAGLVVWRDHTDLLAGTTIDRLEQALTQGLSAAVLVVTPDIVHSEIVRERELPRLLQLDDDPSFSLCIANVVARNTNHSKCDFDAPDRLLRLTPARTLADKKQSNMLDPVGEMEIVRDLLMHRIQQRKTLIHQGSRPFTIRVQTRPAPSALDAHDDDLHIRINAAGNGRLPSSDGLKLLQTTLPLIGDGVYAAGSEAVRISGGAHLSVALALGAALPETKIGRIEVADNQGQHWSSSGELQTMELATEILHCDGSQQPASRSRVAIFASLTPNPDRTAFERLVNESTEGFNTAVMISTTGNGRIEAHESGSLSAAIAQRIKQISADTGRAEVHLAFHGPYTMAVLVGRYLNTLRTTVYEWTDEYTSGPRYIPVVVLEPGVTNGPITAVLT